MDYRQIILEAGIHMAETGLTVETWGNISLRDPETGLIYITPSGMAYDRIEKEDICVLNNDGTIHEAKRTPSVEAPMHVRIYQERPEINAILHTHPIQSTVFAVLRKDIPVFSDEMAQAFGETIKVSKYALPGSDALAENVVKALGTNMACLIANHGAVSVGKDIKEAFKTSTVLETSAEIYQKVLAIGDPVLLNEDDVAYMRDFALNKYGKGNNS